MAFAYHSYMQLQSIYILPLPPVTSTCLLHTSERILTAHDLPPPLQAQPVRGVFEPV